MHQASLFIISPQQFLKEVNNYWSHIVQQSTTSSLKKSYLYYGQFEWIVQFKKNLNESHLEVSKHQLIHIGHQKLFLLFTINPFFIIEFRGKLHTEFLQLPPLYVPVQMYLNSYLGFRFSSRIAGKASWCHPVSLTQNQCLRKIVKLRLPDTWIRH